MNYKQHLVFGIALGIGAQFASEAQSVQAFFQSAGVANPFHLGNPLKAEGLLAVSKGLLSYGVFYGSLALGSLAPDIDHPRSYVGGRVWGWLVPKIGKEDSAGVRIARLTHRKFTHSIPCVALLGYLLQAVWKANPFAYAGFFLGYLSHLIGDMLTPSGVPLAYPIRKRFRIFPLISSERG